MTRAGSRVPATASSCAIQTNLEGAVNRATCQSYKGNEHNSLSDWMQQQRRQFVGKKAIENTLAVRVVVAAVQTVGIRLGLEAEEDVSPARCLALGVPKQYCRKKSDLKGWRRTAGRAEHHDEERLTWWQKLALRQGRDASSTLPASLSPIPYQSLK